jgi:GTP-binding protein SAR1
MLEWISGMFKGILGTLGLYHKEANIVFVGLDNAGKTTLLQMLKDDKYSQQLPTQQPHMEELVMGKIRFQTFDLGGHEIARKLWKDYCTVAQAIIFLVDAAAKARFPDSKKELDSVLSMPELSNVPIAILGNKIDKKGAASEEELREAYGLPYEVTWGKDPKKKTGTGRPIEIFMCSVAKRMGYVEAFQWISNFLD